MKEKLLQYIWQFQHYNSQQLTTTDGEPLEILHQGNYNTNQGADFSSARIRLRHAVWAGNIELHCLSSDWDLHGHSTDRNYSNIILHVVWKHDRDIIDRGGNRLATLELQSRVARSLLERYELLMQKPLFIPCEAHPPGIPELRLSAWKQRLVAGRLLQRSQTIFAHLAQNEYNMEETCWWMLATGFGMRVNAEAFEKIAKSLPLKLLAQHRHHVDRLEALLLGQAGLLENEFKEEYPQRLRTEYLFYKKKYGLTAPGIQLFFLRMRPANFPSLRLAQLAVLLSESTNIFATIRDSRSVMETKKLLAVSAGAYWDHHYVPGEISPYKKKRLGAQMVNGLLINTVVPMLFAWGMYHDEEEYKEKAIAWLDELDAEKNSITAGFDILGYHNRTAFDSQAFIQLKNNYCNHKRCLECEIGNSIMNPRSQLHS